jgi:hypothetical protein
MTPPTLPGELKDPRRTGQTWPMVIGIIGIVFGAWGVMKGIGAFVAPFIQRFFSSMAASNPGIAIAQKYQAFTIAFGAVHLVVSVALIVLCAYLIQRRRNVAPMFVLFGVINVVRVVVEAVMQGWMQHQTFQAMAQSSQPGAAMVASVTPVFLVFGVFIALVLGSAFPVFLIIWFRRKPIIAQVAAWPHRV